MIEVVPEVVALGVVFGLVHGLLAVGLVLVYRASRVLNLAHAEIGVFAATLLGLAVTRWQVPYWFALVGAVGVGAGIGIATEVVVVRRLRHVPRIMTVVATLGLGQLLALVAPAMVGPGEVVTFPEPPGVPGFDLGALPVGPSVTAMVVLGPLLAAGLAAWLVRSRVGLELRAAAARSTAAQLAGIPAARWSALAWAIAGGLATVVAALVGAAPGFLGGTVSGPGLLLRALAAAVLARMTSLPGALAAGVGIGVVEQVTFWNAEGGVVDALLFAIVLVAMALLRPGRADRSEPWMAVEAWRPLPEGLASQPVIRRARQAVSGVAVVAVVVTVAVVSNATATRLAALVAVAVVAVSVGLVTGLGGRLTLGQFAVAGVGAVASLWVAASTGSLVLGLVAAAATGAAVAVVVALPALRGPGPLLAVATLAFAVAVQRWVLPRPWALGTGVEPAPAAIGPFVADTGRRYLVVAVLVGTLVLWVVRNLRTSGLGRRIAAVRDNPAAARAVAIDPVRTVLLAIALGGAVAGVGGALHAHALAVVTASAFPLATSILVVAMAVVGGIGTFGGPVLGALLIAGVPLVVPLDAAGLVGIAAGWFLVIVYVPRGLAAPAAWARDRVVAFLVARTGGEGPVGPGAAAVGDRPLAARPGGLSSQGGATGASLQVRGLCRSFGAVRAVDEVDLRLEPGQLVGLVGPNGAGKSTLVDLLAGFEVADRGRVLLDGRDVTALPAPARAASGIVRSFQDPRAFPTMTVLDTVRVSLEHRHPTRILPAVVGLRPPERQVTARATELLDLVGLRDQAHVHVRNLSTGMRRVCELACLLGLSPGALLLDEPSSGLASSELPGLLELLAALHDRLGVTLLVVEHDRALVEALGGHVLTMDDGRLVDADVVATGPGAPTSSVE